MIPTKTRPANLAKLILASSLAALCIAPTGFAQSADASALRRLQEENAALRKQLAEMQGKAAPAAPAFAPSPAKAAVAVATKPAETSAAAKPAEWPSVAEFAAANAAEESCGTGGCGCK